MNLRTGKRLERGNTPRLDVHSVTAQVAQAEHAQSVRFWLLGTRVMMLVSALVFAVSAGLVVVRSTWWSHTFGIQNITLHGDTQYHSARETLLHLHNAQNLDHEVLGQHYWNVDLRALQKSLEAMPWIQSARVQREFPNGLRVDLVAYKAAARWADLESMPSHASSDELSSNADDAPPDAFEEALGNAPANDSPAALDEETNTAWAWMVSPEGVVFDASGVTGHAAHLPLLEGHRQEAPLLLQTWQSLQARMVQKNAALSIHTLRRDALGLWRAKSEKSTFELGGGSSAQVLARVEEVLASPVYERMTQTFPAASWRSVDLRYAGALALKAQGVDWVSQPQQPKPRPKLRPKPTPEGRFKPASSPRH